MSTGPEKHVVLGRITGAYGVKGWVKVQAYTEPRDNIIGFTHWFLALGDGRWSVDVEAGRRQGKGVIAKLRGIDDRDRAQQLTGAEVAVPRSALPVCEAGEYYWHDLEGLSVETRAGERLGRVRTLIATGAHDVLVVAGERERLIPFAPGRTVAAVDFERGTIVVDWDPSY
jgi:16S rRNA processing protein RimM